MNIKMIKHEVRDIYEYRHQVWVMECENDISRMSLSSRDSCNDIHRKQSSQTAWRKLAGNNTYPEPESNLFTTRPLHIVIEMHLVEQSINMIDDFKRIFAYICDKFSISIHGITCFPAICFVQKFKKN